MTVLSSALLARSTSRQDDLPAMEVVAALRDRLGSRAVTAAAGPVDTGPGGRFQGGAPGAPVHR